MKEGGEGMLNVSNSGGDDNKQVNAVPYVVGRQWECSCVVPSDIKVKSRSLGWARVMAGRDCVVGQPFFVRTCPRSMIRTHT